MVKTKAAVFPVPDWDCPIMFVGLRPSTLDDHIKKDTTENYSRIIKQQWKGAFLDLGWVRKAHVVNSFEEVLVSRNGLNIYNAGEDGRRLTSQVLQMFSHCTEENLGPVAGRLR
jgi:hypothetical protein